MSSSVWPRASGEGAAHVEAEARDRVFAHALLHLPNRSAVGHLREEGTTMEGLLTRSLTEADRDLLAALASRVSPQSMISRFHGAVRIPSPSLLDRLLDLAPGQREALIALDDQVVVAVVRYARDTQEGDTAEVAALVADEWQHHGVGLELMRQLASRARAAGISRFRGDMLSDNAGAQRLMTALGQAVSSRRADGHTVMIIDLAPS